MGFAIHSSDSPSSTGRRGQKLGWATGRLVVLLGFLMTGLAVTGCQRGPSAESQRLDRVDLKLQQLEQRLNKLSVRAEDGADKAGKPPAGVIKSLTLRMGSEDDRLRIYWADGSKTDLPCTKEQSTFVCG
ncbi:MAG: hypothetical protein RLZZ609_2847 [Cyanobacteriota bacterium]|jgi:hypothetical protein